MAKAFYFAWVDAGTAFDPNVHNVEDEKIVRFGIEHLETEFALLTIDIKNPKIGLLNAGRKLWAWLSCDQSGIATPMFYGRVQGIPSNINAEVVTLVFIARPVDFGTQKELLAASMRVLPFYDPVFIKSDLLLDPDIVLEGRTDVWHIDRVTHDVSTSNLLVGEDGTLEFDEDEVPYSSVEVSLDQPPIRKVRVTAEVPWDQNVSGSGLTLLRNYKIPTLAGSGVINGWPDAGASLGGGWNVTSSRASSPYTNFTEAEWAGWAVRYGANPATPRPPFAVNVISSFSSTVSEGAAPEQSITRFVIIEDQVTVDLSIGYEASRKRKDIVTFDLLADTQPIVTDPGDDEVLELQVSGNDVGLPIGTDIDYAEIPLEHPSARAYFTTARGEASLQYLIQLARANIIVRSRAVKIKFVCSFERALALSLRKNAQLHDRRLPGGQALGKIVGYAIRSEGGRRYGEVSIACAIGYGGAIAADIGTPTYVEEGYVDEGYQYYENAIIVSDASDVGYTPLAFNPNDDGLVFPLRGPPLTIMPHTVTVQQKELPDVQPTVSTTMQVDECGNTASISINSSLDTGPYQDWLSNIKTTVNFRLKNVTGGPFESPYTLAVTDLKLPKQIDLEAPIA